MGNAMSKSNTSIVILLVAVSVFVGYASSKFLAQGTQAVVYTATYTERLTDSKGSIQEHRFMFARRPDASVRINIGYKPDGSESRVRLITTSDSTIFVVDDAFVKSTIYHPPVQSIPFMPQAQQSRYQRIGIAKSFGFDANLLTADNKTSKVERWIIPDLNNLVVKDLRQWKDKNGTIISTSEQNVTELVLELPDPDLFTVPEAYVEKMPSEIQFILFNDVLKRNVDLNYEALQRADAVYFNSLLFKR